MLVSRVTTLLHVKDKAAARYRLIPTIKSRLWYRPEQVDTCFWTPLRSLDLTVEEAQVGAADSDRRHCVACPPLHSTLPVVVYRCCAVFKLLPLSLPSLLRTGVSAVCTSVPCTISSESPL